MSLKSKLRFVWQKKWKTAAGLATVIVSYAAKKVALKYQIPDDVVSQALPQILDLTGLGGGALAVVGLRHRVNANHDETKAMIEELRKENQDLLNELKSEIESLPKQTVKTRTVK